MSASAQEEHTNERQDGLLAMLEHLLELPISAVPFLLDQAVLQVQQVLAADLVAFFFHDVATDTLVPLHSSDTFMGRQQLANGGSVVEVFLSGVPLLTCQAVQTLNEAPDIIADLGMESQMAVVFRVQTRHRGVVVAASARPDFFSANDLPFLEAIARWVGQVVGRSELVEQMQQPDTELDQRWATEQLLTFMTHELRNFLQPLRGRLDLLLERAKRDGREKDVRDVESSLHTLHLLSRGISDVVDITRLNQGVFALTPVPVDLKAVVQDVVKSVEVRPIGLSVRSPAEIIVTADPQRIRQALETMLSYVANATSNSAEITVDVTNESRADGPWALVHITSIGSAQPGISESHLHSFVASSHSTQLGVQLYLTNQIALAHHGSFTIDSAPDHSCRLTLAFPVEEEELIVRGEDDLQVMM